MNVIKTFILKPYKNIFIVQFHKNICSKMILKYYFENRIKTFD